MFDRMLSVVVALSLALLVWLYARSRDQEVLDNVPVPVQVALAPEQADHYRLELTGPNHVMVSFTGSPLRIRELQSMLQHNDLQVLLTFTVPAEHLHESHYNDSILVESSDVHTPPGVTAMTVEGRNHVSLILHRLVARRLPVRFESVGEEAVGPLVVEPATVLVRGPQEVLDHVRTISTQPSEWPTRSPAPGSFARVPLVQEMEGRPIETTPNRVTVRMPVQARKVYELPEVPVHFLCPVDFPLRPKFFGERAGRIGLRVRGPARDEQPKVHAFVDLIQGHCSSPGRYHEPIQLQLPKDFELAQELPRGVSFQLVPADAAPRNPDDTIPAP
jgi:hypothetical protein